MLDSAGKGIKKDCISAVSVVMVTLVIAVLFYVLNFYTPLFADDYSYSFSFSTGERIESVSQIVDSQIAHYQIMNGRSITHSLAQVFLLVGDRIFNYVNVFFFLLLILLVYFHACGTFRNFSLSKYTMIAMLLFLSTPAFGQSYLWITGAANYLYGILIVLCVLIPYRLYINVDSSNFHPLFEALSACIYFFLCIIAGWTNENTSIAMIVMMIGYIARFCLKSRRIHAWSVTGCIGGIIGCMLVLLSPGTAKRLEVAGGSGGIFSWLKRVVLYSCDMIVYFHLEILLFVILLCLYLYQKKRVLGKDTLKKVVLMCQECDVSLIYFLGFLASVYSMIVSPQFPERAWSGPLILFIISIIGFSSLVDMSETRAVVGKRIAFGFALLLFASTYVNAYFELKNVNASYCDRVSIIENARSSGKSSVGIPSICGWSGYSCYYSNFGNSGDLDVDSSKWPNTAIARYYEIGEIKREN